MLGELERFVTDPVELSASGKWSMAKEPRLEQC
jgi:hypothetical protein